MTSEHAHGHGSGGGSEADALRLRAWEPFVLEQLPAAPATVIEIGCGPLGGFVPAMLRAGYDAVGVDPQAPQEAPYRRTEFEQYDPAAPVDAVVACTSLHHVADLATVVHRIAGALRPGGTVVVLEWSWERFDAATAEWCFEHVAPPAEGSEPGWLLRHREHWRESGLPWDAYLRDWATGERLHSGSALLSALTSRFRPTVNQVGPYYFADLHSVDEAEEQAAIDAGRIQPNGVRFVAEAGFPDSPGPA